MSLFRNCKSNQVTPAQDPLWLAVPPDIQSAPLAWYSKPSPWVCQSLESRQLCDPGKSMSSRGSVSFSGRRRCEEPTHRVVAEVGQHAFVRATEDINVITVVVVVVVAPDLPSGGHLCGSGFTDSRSKEPLVDVFVIDWCGPKTLSMPSPWSTLCVTSKGTEAAFSGLKGNGLKGPHALMGCVGGWEGSRKRYTITVVLWGYRCCKNGKMSLVGAEVEPMGTSQALGLSFPEEGGPKVTQGYNDVSMGCVQGEHTQSGAFLTSLPQHPNTKA